MNALGCWCDCPNLETYIELLELLPLRVLFSRFGLSTPETCQSLLLWPYQLGGSHSLLLRPYYFLSFHEHGVASMVRLEGEAN